MTYLARVAGAWQGDDGGREVQPHECAAAVQVQRQLLLEVGLLQLALRIEEEEVSE